MSEIGGWNPPGKIRICGECRIAENTLPEGVTMMICSGCRVLNYCSASCQKRAWKSHKRFCLQHCRHEATVQETALCSPIEASAEQEALSFMALVQPEVSRAMEHANKIDFGTSLAETHNAVLHFAYDASQPSLRRRFIFQSGKLLPRVQVRQHVSSIIGYYRPQLDTALLPSDIVKVFPAFNKDGGTPSVVLNLFTPLTSPSSLRSPTKRTGNLFSSPEWGFQKLQPIGFAKRPSSSAIGDWERVLRVSLSGEQPKDQDEIESLWIVESGNARAYMDSVRWAKGEAAYRKEVELLGPLLLKKEAEEKAKRQAESLKGGSAPREK